MYVRIVQDGLEDLYHCGNVNFRPHAEDEGAVLVNMEGIPQIGQVAHVVHKDTDEVYIMNDQGQTIDSYVWIE